MYSIHRTIAVDGAIAIQDFLAVEVLHGRHSYCDIPILESKTDIGVSMGNTSLQNLRSIKDLQ